MGGIITARERYEMLAPWVIEAIVKTARYPQEWKGEAPYGRFGNGRARNRPPSVLHDPDDPSAGTVDPDEIQYEQEGNSVSAYHPDGTHLGNYSWDEGYDGNAHISIAQVNPKYQGQGVAGGIIDHIREHHQPDLAHSGYRGEGSLSYQGRAGALRDLGNTEEEHYDYFNTTPYNHGQSEPAIFDRKFQKTDAQQRAHNELMQHFIEDQQHPSFTGDTSGSYDPDMKDDYGDRHEYGHDQYGDYVGLSDGGKDQEGYSDEGYNYEGYDREGLNRDGIDEDGFDSDGFSQDSGLNSNGETRHGYTPGHGEAPEGTVSMDRMGDHWAQNGLSPTSQDHQDMMDHAEAGVPPTMYGVREPRQRSNHTGDYHVGNGDTLYSSLDRARQVAYHPDDPTKDKDIVSVDHLDPEHLHTDATGKTPHDFHYAPESDWDDAEDTASTRANIVHDPQRHQRMQNYLGRGWTPGTMPAGQTPTPSLHYTDPNSERSGRMWQQGNGAWRTEHEPQFGNGSANRGQHSNFADAARHVVDGTAPGPNMDHHAMELNNDYHGTGQGEVSWEPHPTGMGLSARTPHGDLHLTQSPNTGAWDWHAGPHGSQPGDEGNMRNMLPASDRNHAAIMGIQAIKNRPFHGGLADELGEGWRPHPSASGAYTQQLPSGNHAFVSPHPDGGYTSGIQRDDGAGQPRAAPIRSRPSPDLAQAQSFINHHENPVPAKALGEGWGPVELGRRSYPAYGHEGHSSGAMANVAMGDEGWKPTVHHNGDMFEGPGHKTPQEAAGWAHGVMNDLGKMSPGIA